MPNERIVNFHGKKWYTFRVRDPSQFIPRSLRSLDIGYPQRHIMIRGRLKRNMKWATRSLLVEKNYYANSSLEPKLTKKMLKQLKRAEDIKVNK